MSEGEVMSSLAFSKQMRKATREIHNISDALVNAKLGFALSDDRVWAEGLLVFYEIFRYLEEAMDRLGHTYLGDLNLQEMKRTAAFEADIAHYLGPDWHRSYEIRESVAKYLQHLEEVEANSPHLLVAYIYHLYMGLLSGGQILRQKINLSQRLHLSKRGEGGMAVMDFSPSSISSLKKRLREIVDRLAEEELSPEAQQEIMEESRTVFVLNNELVRSVKGANEAILRKIMMLFGFLLMAYAMVKIYAWI